ncbi:MAG: MSMEG_0565 family glycosyltransferase, partial [Comamonadaceae bacterium]
MSDTALRIALLTHSFNPRGGVVHTLELAEALRALGHAPTVFAPARAGERLFRAVGVPVERVPLLDAPDAPAAPAADLVADVGQRIEAFAQHLQGTGAQHRFDIFHAHDPIGANALIQLRERGRVPHVVRTVHHLDVYTQPRLAAWQARGFLQADQVLCVSTLWQETLRAEHGVQAGLVFNGVDTRRFHPAPGLHDTLLRQRLGLDAGTPVVLSLGGIEARKNTVRLLQAFAQLRSTWPAARLVVAGGASLLDHRASAQAFEQALGSLGLRSGPGQAVLVTGPLRR